MANPQMWAEKVIVVTLDGTIQQIVTGSNPLLVQQAVIEFDADVVSDALIMHAVNGAIPGSITTSNANRYYPSAGGYQAEIMPWQEHPGGAVARTDLRHWFIKMSASGGKARVRYWQPAECVTPA